ncbi:Hypothetical Protein FCC1311_005662 [Hondaea fermentalgiana]|uniref:Uncharacterized protein n=1 Tax=Hondaea fermentalgiana TaxID=2315210 RepID=A0A2R5G3L7_9STRA|nr:Hypothetical Protein FCC1311_005662 [Hondaea fermentalgiana]|eukprot:GBG24348.1 Hypothetical Protein FCC1311_005662 [Hondaea fermentalgiana]
MPADQAVVSVTKTTAVADDKDSSLLLDTVEEDLDTGAWTPRVKRRLGEDEFIQFGSMTARPREDVEPPQAPCERENVRNDSEEDSIALQAVMSRISAQARAAENAANQGDPSQIWRDQDEAEGIASLSKGMKLSVKDSFWFLDTLEDYHLSRLGPEDRRYLEGLSLRDKAKHRNAVLFEDDEDFILRRREDKLRFDAQAFQESTCSDSRVYLIQQATLAVMLAYAKSLLHAPAKSCIWSSLMYRVAHHLQRSGFTDVSIAEHVRGVKHKEATLLLQGYHISRSNFSKLCRQLLRKEVAVLHLNQP